MICKPRPRDSDDMPLDELGIFRSDLGLDPDHAEDDHRGEREEAERQRREDAKEAERERLKQEWDARERRMEDALRHIAKKLQQ